MTVTAPVGTRDALAPVREALLADAREEAAALLSDADAEADALLAQARDEAAAIRGRARQLGAEDAAAVLAVARARSRREGRRVVLAAQRRAVDDLRARARVGVGGLSRDPEHTAVLRALVARARADLGPGAEVADDGAGGVVVTAGSRRLALSLDALADHLVDRLGPDLEGLWRP